MLKAKFAAFAGALILAGTAFANQNVCPELSAIQTEGVTIALPIWDTLYGVYQYSTFGTDANWSFIIAPVDADSEEDAVSAASDLLSGMTAPGVLEDVEGVVMCSYETGNIDLYALAIQEAFVSPMKLKQLIQRSH